jgi:Ni/Co efflux regulator RcnB
MRSRVLLLSSIIGACVIAAPAALHAQRFGRVDRGRYELDHPRYDIDRHLESARIHAAERAESRSEARAESRARESLRRSDRAYMREDRAMRLRERSDATQAMRARTRYRW